jgi:predicted nucleotidyltransferase
MDREDYMTIVKYRKKLETLGVKARKIILYGSHASGRAKEYSDLDLVVVSDDFKSMNLWDRLWLLGQARIDIERPMEILGFTVEEYESDQCDTFIRDEVKAKGIEVV